jgi:hypothetical protein
MSTEEKSLSEQMGKFPPEMYGSAEISLAERKALRNLYLSLREKIFGNKKGLSSDERTQLKEAVKESVVGDGWPELKDLSTADLAETAVSHACVVAEHLYKERGEAATPDTVWSYTTKNQFDRFVKITLIRSGKMNDGSAFKADWDSPKERAIPNRPETIKYPENVDNTKIHGIAKVERYWPAQLMRYLEAVRLGKASQSDLEKLKVQAADPEIYKIPWDNFKDVIKEADSVEDVAVGIGVKTLEILKERGLRNDQLIATLLTGYSPGGPTNEHGNIPEIGSVWKKIVKKVESDDILSDLSEELKEAITKRFQEIGYPSDSLI